MPSLVFELGAENSFQVAMVTPVLVTNSPSLRLASCLPAHSCGMDTVVSKYSPLTCLDSIDSP